MKLGVLDYKHVVIPPTGLVVARMRVVNFTVKPNYARTM